MNSRKRFLWSGCRRKGLGTGAAGFTLLEMLAVMAILGILMAIAATSWIGFLENWTLNAAQDRVRQELRLAQSQAERTRQVWQFSLQQRSDGVRVAVHPASRVAAPTDWVSLHPQVRLMDEPGIADTTLRFDRNEGVYQVQFHHRQGVQGQLGKVTLTIGSGRKQRCVVISTLLGHLRADANRGCL